MYERESIKWIVVIAFLVISFIARAIGRGSWPKGAFLVAAVVAPAFVILDLVNGGTGFGLWLFMPVGAALLTYTLIFFLSPRNRADDGGFGTQQDEGDDDGADDGGGGDFDI